MVRETVFARAARILVEEKDFTALARKFFDICRELTGATVGYVALLSKDRTSNEVLFLEAGGLPCTVDPDLPMPIRGLRELAYARKKPVFDNDFMKSDWVKLMPAGPIALDNVLFAPLVVDGTAFGIMGLANKPGNGFTDEDAQAADTLAELLAVGLKSKRNETVFVESEVLFRSTIEQSADGIVLTDFAMRIVEWNLAMEQLFGYSRGEMIGRHLAEFQVMTTPPEQRTDGKVEALKKRLSELQQPEAQKWMNHPQEMPAVNKYGDKKILQITVFPIFNERGTRFGSIVRDITKQKQIEKTLDESRERFFSLFSNMAEGVCLHELVFNTSGEPVDYRILDCNKQFETILGLKKNDVLGKTATEAYSTAEPPFFKEYAAVALSGNPLVFDTFFAPLEKFLSISIAPWGKNGFATIFTDITGRKRSAEAVIESEKLLRKAQVLADIGHFSYDPETGLVNGSDMLYTIFGLPKSPAPLDTLIGIVHPDDRAYTASTIANVVKTGKGCTIECWLVCKGGSRKFVRAIFEREPARDPNAVRLVGTMQDITPRKLAEQALRASKERYRSIVENMNDAFLIHDANGMIFDCNDNACRMLGYGRDELVGENLSTIDTPENARLIARNIARIRETGHAVFDSEQVRKDGSRVAVNVSARLVSAKDNGLIQSFIRDITERKKAEVALAASEEMFSKAFRSSPMAIGLSEFESGKMIDVNEAFCRTIEYLRDEIIGSSGAELGFWFKPEQRYEIIGLIRNPGKDRFIETQCRTKSGKILDVILSAETITWKGIKCLLISAFNITDRKKAEASLRASERRNRDLLAAIPDLMFKIRKDGTIVDFKYDQPEQLIIPPDKVKGTNAFDLPFSARDKAVLKRAIGDTLATGEMQTFQYSLPASGKNRIYDARTVREDEDSIIAIIRDVTELKEAEENQIKTEKLESIGALAGGIAHDFNNLLGGVFGYLDMAKEQAEAGNSARAAALLAKSLAVFERAKGLTAQFLTFARGGAPAKKTGDLRKTITDTVAFALSGSPVSCTKDIAPDLWTCDYDENQIGQVIDNLVINAKQAMEKGGTLEVSAANVALEKGSPLPLPDGRYVKISFKDNGPGIPLELHRKIFDPFFTTKKKGSGLGLATAFSIVKRHDGHLDLESEPGKGATFTFWLPASASSIVDKPKLAAPAVKIKARILIMDDEQYMRELAASALKSLGCRATTAKNGEDALEKFAAARATKKEFDAVILDLTIPGGMGGKEAAQKLLQADPAARLIVSSGYSDDPIMAEPAKYGFSASIGKPYKKEALASVLAEVLGKRKK